MFQQVPDLTWPTPSCDESVVHEQLLLLQRQLEDGHRKPDFVEREAELLARPRSIKERKRELESRLRPLPSVPVSSPPGTTTPERKR